MKVPNEDNNLQYRYSEIHLLYDDIDANKNVTDVLINIKLRRHLFFIVYLICGYLTVYILKFFCTNFCNMSSLKI